MLPQLPLANSLVNTRKPAKRKEMRTISIFTEVKLPVLKKVSESSVIASAEWIFIFNLRVFRIFWQETDLQIKTNFQ